MTKAELELAVRVLLRAAEYLTIGEEHRKTRYVVVDGSTHATLEEADALEKAIEEYRR